VFGTWNSGPNNGCVDGVQVYERAYCPGWDWDNDGVDDLCAEPVLFAPLNGTGLDISPSSHNVSNNGNVSAGTDRCGTTGAAMSFSGSNYLSLPDSPDFAFGPGDYTISLWVARSDATPSAMIGQWAQGLQTGGGGDDGFFLAYETRRGGTALYDITNNGVGDIHLDLSPAVSSTWHHFAAVTSSGTTTIYFDGNDVGSLAMGAVWDSSYDLTIGSLRNGLDAITGQIDDVAIWRAALTTAEIGALYASDCWDDADGDGVTADVDCDDNDPAAPAQDADCDGVLTANDCDDGDPNVGAPGSAVNCAGASCLQILNDGGSTGDGTYWIDPDGTGAFQVDCDMTTDGGGWTGIVSHDYQSDSCPSNSLGMPTWSRISAEGLCYSAMPFLLWDSQASASFETLGVSYTEILGSMSLRVYYSMDAFNQPEGRSDIDSSYVDGVSVTTGASGSRTHVFTYATLMVNYPNCGSAPSFVGSNYLCDAVPNQGAVWSSDTLFASGTFQASADGTSPIEVRMLSNEGYPNEAVGISTIDLYVR